MSFRALLVSKDDQAVEALTPVLSNFGLTVHRCGYPDALCLVSEQKFHAVLVDFDDPHSATLTFENLSAARFRATCRHRRPSGRSIQSAKCLRRRAQTSFSINLCNGEQAEGTLRAAASLIRSERRSSFRVPVQVPVMLTSNGDEASVPGILLDLSEDGMDVLASQPLYCSAVLNARFILPDLLSDLQLPGEVVWANPNGESGIRFAEVPEDMRGALRKWLARTCPASVPARTRTPSRLQSYRSERWRLLRRNYLTVSRKNSLAAEIARGWQRTRNSRAGSGHASIAWDGN